MDQNFRKRQQKTLYSGQLEPAHYPLALTEMAVEFYQNLAPCEDPLDLDTASNLTSQQTVSPASMVMGMMYARRLQRKRPDRLRKLSSSDLFLISMMMASKYLYDEGVEEEVFNDEWADNAGMGEEDINNMEMDFLDALEWELFIGKEDFEQAMLSIEKSIAMKEGLKRGWFSYTDLILLLEESCRDLALSGAALTWIKVTVMCAALYCAAVVSGMLMVSAGLALTSSGLSPTSLSTSPMTLAVPQSLSCDPSSDHVGKSPQVSPTSSTTVHSNETEEMLEGEVSTSLSGKEEQAVKIKDEVITMSKSTLKDDLLLSKRSSPVKEPVSGLRDKDHPQPGGKAFADTIMSQLIAVITLKSHLVQAVSDKYKTATCNNLFKASVVKVTAPGCDESARNIKAVDQVGTEAAGVISSSWINKIPSSDQEVPQECLQRCGGWSVIKPEVCSMDLLDLQQCCDRWCKGTGLEAWREEPSCRRQHAEIQQCRAHCQCQRHVTKTCASHQIVQRDVASVRRLFPDVVIGFSTSMPAYAYAT